MLLLKVAAILHPHSANAGNIAVRMGYLQIFPASATSPSKLQMVSGMIISSALET